MKRARFFRVEFLRSRRRLLRQVKSWVGRVSPEDPIIRDYKINYEREFLGNWRPVKDDVLFKKIRESDIVLGADFHAYAQAQRTHLRILREIGGTKKICLAMEVFHSRHQKYLNLFMSGELSEAHFLEKVRWNATWGFPWEHYRPLILWAKENNCPVVGVNVSTSKSMDFREKHAAGIVDKLSRKYELVYVIFGDFHLARNQLPKKIQKLGEKKTVIVHQDSERLYFQLAGKNKEFEVRLMESKGNRFCVFTSPPWVKWQSYMFFLEGRLDQDIDDIDETLDLSDHLKNFILMLTKDLKLKVKAEGFSAYGSDSSAIWKILKKYLSAAEVRRGEFLMEHGTSFYVPEAKVFYLAHGRVNHAAHVCGDYLQAKLSGRRRLLWNMPNDYLPLIWLEMLAFFASKLMNDRRKPDKVQNLYLENHRIAKEVLLLILDQKVEGILWPNDKKPRGRKKFRIRHKSSFYLSARLLGGALGERLYAQYRSGAISQRVVLDWLKKDVDGPGFLEFYRTAVKRLDARAKTKQTESRL